VLLLPLPALCARFPQIWRLNDLLYRPEDEVLAELEAHK
jgi:hypothetical protein